MPNLEIELKPVDFVTIGTIGTKGQRMFHLQAGQSNQLITLLIEKEQASILLHNMEVIFNRMVSCD